MATLPLNVSGEVTLDSAGDGTVRLSPDGPSEHWFPSLASVKVATATAEAQCRIYAGPKVADEYFIDGTLSGSTGDSTDRVSGYEIARTRTPYLWAKWTGGDAGAQATLVVNGTREVR